MKIVINSHIKGAIALNHLLESINYVRENNDKDKKYDIIIVIGGYYSLEKYEIEKQDNITIIKCNHNSIDFTGLIALLELFFNNKDEYYFYLHDTCKIGINFFKKLESINLTNVSSVKIHRHTSMNIGIYSQQIINNYKDFLLSKKNTDENKCTEFKVNSHEDHIFNTDGNNIIFENYDGYIHSVPFDYYFTGTMRKVEYYPNLDLYKIKANYGQIPWIKENMIMNN